MFRLYCAITAKSGSYFLNINILHFHCAQTYQYQKMSLSEDVGFEN